MTTPDDWQQQGDQQPHQPPPGYQGMPTGYHLYRKTNGLAIASLVLGITGIIFVTAILAVIFAPIARTQIRQRGEAGDGLAIAGLVLGIVWLSIHAFRLIVFGAIMHRDLFGG